MPLDNGENSTAEESNEPPVKALVVDVSDENEEASSSRVMTVFIALPTEWRSDSGIPVVSPWAASLQ